MKKHGRSPSSRDNDFNSKKSSPRSDSLSSKSNNVSVNVRKILNVMAKIHCSFCKKDISKIIKVICNVCPDTIYCLECLVQCKTKDEINDHMHDYHIADKQNFIIFTSDWKSIEELQLLAGKILTKLFV